MKTVNLTFVKSTKNTHVYGTQDANAAVSQLYIQKEGMPATPPPAIKLTVEWEE